MGTARCGPACRVVWGERVQSPFLPDSVLWLAGIVGVKSIDQLGEGIGEEAKISPPEESGINFVIEPDNPSSLSALQVNRDGITANTESNFEELGSIIKITISVSEIPRWVRPEHPQALEHEHRSIYCLEVVPLRISSVYCQEKLSIRGWERNSKFRFQLPQLIFAR